MLYSWIKYEVFHKIQTINKQNKESYDSLGVETDPDSVVIVDSGEWIFLTQVRVSNLIASEWMYFEFQWCKTWCHTYIDVSVAYKI